jgi:RNA polymerase sigma-70 factor (ECF subfamily)
VFTPGKAKERRDAAWLPAVVARYEALLLRYALRRTGDAEQAQDLVQSAFLKLIEHPTIGDDDLPQWLYTVIKHEFLDACRAARVREQHSADLPLAEPGPSALAAAIGHDDLDCLFKALAALTALQKRVVELRFVEDLSYREIARLTKKTENHVGVLLHESLQKLRVKHQEECGDFLDGLPL